MTKVQAAIEELRLIMKAYFLIEVDLSIYNITSSLKQTTKTDIMNLAIFKERRFNIEKNQDEQTVNQLLEDGGKVISLAKIIETRKDKLDDLIFEIVRQGEDRIEEPAYNEQSEKKQYLKIKVRSIDNGMGQNHQLIQLLDMTSYVMHAQLKSDYA